MLRFICSFKCFFNLIKLKEVFELKIIKEPLRIVSFHHIKILVKPYGRFLVSWYVNVQFDITILLNWSTQAMIFVIFCSSFWKLLIGKIKVAQNTCLIFAIEFYHSFCMRICILIGILTVFSTCCVNHWEIILNFIPIVPKLAYCQRLHFAPHFEKIGRQFWLTTQKWFKFLFNLTEVTQYGWRFEESWDPLFVKNWMQHLHMNQFLAREAL